MLITQILATAFVIVGIILLLYTVVCFYCLGNTTIRKKVAYCTDVLFLSNKIIDYIIAIGVVIIIYELTLHLIS